MISKNQTTFIGGRQILDGMLIANELVDDAKRKGRSMAWFKVDSKKVYDSVSWEFSIYMMHKMGFGKRWRDWIKECVSTTKMSVLVNGSPT